MDLYEGRDWKNAHDAFSQVVKLFPDDGPSPVYLERCRQYMEFPPGADWDGIVNLTEK
jgi:adenylate cyclase